MELINIDEATFIALEGVRQLISDVNARRFALLRLGSRLGVYGLSWQSDLVDPLIAESGDKSTIWVGIDTYLAGVDTKCGGIRFALSLHSNIVKILVTDRVVIILTETELMILNNSRSIHSLHDLPDIAATAELVGDQIIVKLISGESITKVVD